MCYEGVCHLTGWYPVWWPGRKFNDPITGWAAGEDVKSLRESLQPTLLGKPGEHGTGLIPGDALLRTAPRSGVPDAIDFVEVKYKDSNSETSRLVLKTYDQGRESFQASSIKLLMLDEEPPLTIYNEGLTRTMSTVPGERNGIVMGAFTPLKGLSDTVLQFLPGGQIPQTAELRKTAWGWSEEDEREFPSIIAAIDRAALVSESVNI
jgi:phage terminase large subunit-like protein